MAAPRHKKINLLVKEGFEFSEFGRVINWALSAGRAILIGVELVVILAFFSRFWLDKTLNDLNEDNSYKKLQIEASAPFETEFNQIQNKLLIYSKHQQTGNPADTVQLVATLLPAEIALTKISFLSNKISLEGTSLSEGGIAGFVKSLQDSGKFANPTLASVGLDSTGQQVIKFTIDTTLKK